MSFFKSCHVPPASPSYILLIYKRNCLQTRYVDKAPTWISCIACGLQKLCLKGQLICMQSCRRQSCSIVRRSLTHVFLQGAGTLIRRGNKVHVITKLSEIEDIGAFKEVLIRDREALDARATVDQYVQFLEKSEFKAYSDAPMECLAVVLPPQGNASMAQLATFTTTKAGWLTNVSDNVFAQILKDFPKIMWTVWVSLKFWHTSVRC